MKNQLVNVIKDKGIILFWLQKYNYTERQAWHVTKVLVHDLM
jgi:hypothetical protein